MSLPFMNTLKIVGVDLQIADALHNTLSTELQNKICGLDWRVIKPLLSKAFQISNVEKIEIDCSIERLLHDPNFMCRLIKEYINGD